MLRKKTTAMEPKRFIPKVAISGPPRAKGDAPLEPSSHLEPVASSSSKHVGEVLEALRSHSEYKQLQRIRNSCPCCFYPFSLLVLNASPLFYSFFFVGPRYPEAPVHAHTSNEVC